MVELEVIQNTSGSFTIISNTGIERTMNGADIVMETFDNYDSLVFFNTESRYSTPTVKIENLTVAGGTDKATKVDVLKNVFKLGTSGGSDSGGGTSPASIAEGINLSTDINAIIIALSNLLTELQLKADLLQIQPVSDELFYTNSYAPNPVNYTTTNPGKKTLDAGGALINRSETYSDAGSFREDFSGSNNETALTGILTFLNSDVVVTGVGTLFLSQLKGNVYIKLTSEADTQFRQIDYIESDTVLYLKESPINSGSGASVTSPVWIQLGTGVTKGLANSLLTLSLGTTATSAARVTRLIDYSPIGANVSLSISQRIANQDLYIGLNEHNVPVARWYARFRLNGTSNTTILTESTKVASGIPVTADIETNTITLPLGLTTASQIDYRIESDGGKCNFYINNNLVATHTRHIPEVYDNLGFGVVAINGTTPATNTDVVIDLINSNNYNNIAINNPSGNQQVGFQGDAVAQGVISIINSNPTTGIATPLSTVAIPLNGNATVGIQVLGPYTGALTPQVSLNGSTWVALSAIKNINTGVLSATIASGTIGIFTAEIAGFAFFRLTALGAVTGTATINLRVSNTTAAVTISGNPAINIAQIVGAAIAAHSAAMSGNPLPVGGRVATASDTTLVALDAAFLKMSADQQAIVKLDSVTDLDFNRAGMWTSGTTRIVKNVPPGNTRNYIKQLTLFPFGLSTDLNMRIQDDGISVTSVAASVMTTSIAHNLNIGDEVVFLLVGGLTGIVDGGRYYVLTTPSTTTFTISTLPNTGSAIGVAGTGGGSFLNKIHFRFKAAIGKSNLSFKFPSGLRGGLNREMQIGIDSTEAISGEVAYNVSGYTGI